MTEAVAITLREKILDVYRKYNFRASPVLDQNFLIDEGVITRAVKYADLKQEDIVLEIGVGLGFLTDEILKFSKVIGYEKDKKLTEFLNDKYSQNEKVQIIIQDFMNAQLPKFNKVISNIPYSLSSPVVFKLLDYDLDVIILFFQAEFAQKMMMKPGDPKYGRLSVMTQYYYDIEMMEKVPRELFYPSPRVDTIILRLKKKPIAKDPKFEHFIQQVFRYKNKTAHNAVKIAFDKDIQDDRKLDTLSIPDLKLICDKVM